MDSSSEERQQRPQILSMTASSLLTGQSSKLVPFPDKQLSFQALNPYSLSVFSYMTFLAVSLVIWLLYLLLPRGFRKQYCHSNRKRYARRIDQRMPAAGYWLPVHSTLPAQTANSMDYGHRNNLIGFPTTIDTTRDSNLHNHDVTPVSTMDDLTLSPLRHASSPGATNRGQRHYSNPPSPEHPALKKIPPNKVIAETMARLQGRGIRLVAHGVHCDPKRVWIRLQDGTENQTEESTINPNIHGNIDSKEEPCVTWQTEFPRRVPNQSGQVSIVLMRGSLHKILLKDVLYIDVGKKTQALQLTKGVPDDTCFSLLTQNGSLDLQANSKLERDSLVSCFSMILDDVHEEDWRALYEASPEQSLANASAINRGTF